MSPERRWLVVSARTPSADLLPLVAEGLLALGGAAVLEQDGALITYVAPPADVAGFLHSARASLRDLLPADAGLEVDWRWRADEDWAARWKQGLAPRRISERLVVKPSWAEWPAQPGEVVIEIDPQMAFGTGEHATTRGCLRLLDRALRAGDRVLDVGSGSGILAIAAARLGAGEVVALEYDADANLNARENLERNGVSGRVRILEAAADVALVAELGIFDLILANILSGVIRPLLPAFHAALRGAGCRLIVGGILAAEQAAVVRDASLAGLVVRYADEEEGWWSALLERAP